MEVKQARGTINPSKGKTPIEIYLGNPVNISIHEININLAIQNTRLADQGITKTGKSILANRL